MGRVNFKRRDGTPVSFNTRSKNKSRRYEEDGEGNAIVIGIIVLVGFAIAVLYYLSKILLQIGIWGTLGFLILLLASIFYFKDKKLIKIGLIGLLVCLISLGIGLGGTSFFEETDFGQQLVNFSSGVMDAGKEYLDLNNEVKQARVDVYEQTSETLEDSLVVLEDR